VRVDRKDVPREKVIRFYATYDRGKKGDAVPADLATWPRHDPDGLDRKLTEHGLKTGVVAAYRTWISAQLSVADLLECAVASDIFPGEPRALGQLVLRGKLAEWLPRGAPTWWRTLGNGWDLEAGAALIVRPALSSEAPAKWYVEDGSGRVLVLLQRILRFGETQRTAWAYIGDTPDERSAFMREHPELKERRPSLGGPAAEQGVAADEARLPSQSAPRS